LVMGIFPTVWMSCWLRQKTNQTIRSTIPIAILRSIAKNKGSRLAPFVSI
jgi:hypothetical protein